MLGFRDQERARLMRQDFDRTVRGMDLFRGPTLRFHARGSSSGSELLDRYVLHNSWKRAVGAAADGSEEAVRGRAGVWPSCCVTRR